MSFQKLILTLAALSIVSSTAFADEGSAVNIGGINNGQGYINLGGYSATYNGNPVPLYRAQQINPTAVPIIIHREQQSASSGGCTTYQDRGGLTITGNQRNCKR